MAVEPRDRAHRVFSKPPQVRRQCGSALPLVVTELLRCRACVNCCSAVLASKPPLCLSGACPGPLLRGCCFAAAAQRRSCQASHRSMAVVSSCCSATATCSSNPLPCDVCACGEAQDRVRSSSRFTLAAASLSALPTTCFLGGKPCHAGARVPAELKHISRRRRRNQRGFCQ